MKQTSNKLNWLSQNAKMRKSSEHIEIFNWGIPAFASQNGTKTCPNAKACAIGCYARSGTYRFGNVKSKYEARLELAQSAQFEAVMLDEIAKAKRLASKRGKDCLIRIHDSGDWFSLDYTMTWLRMIRLNPDIGFYSYTKQVQFFKQLFHNNTHLKRDNLILIYSYGGRQDHLIDPERDRHSRVFQSEAELASEGYIDASHNDTIAIGPNPKIGLVYHGSKNYANTAWDKVTVSD